MDIYSFGMLCLWLIFGSTSAAALPLPGASAEEGRFISFEECWLEANLLETWKMDEGNKLSEWATWLVSERDDVDRQIKDRLAQFFSVTLAYKPMERCKDFDHLLHLLAPDL